ncbi:MAG: type IX secretion system membrane protein PorP/SprF [Bacteroidota bacterium]
MKKVLLLNLFCLIVFPLFGQLDAGNYQLLYDKMLFNPAFTGSRDAAHIAVAYRSAWGNNVDGAPISQIISAHSPLKDQRIAIGATFRLNAIGVTQKWEIGLSYAYRIKVKSGLLSIGLRTSTTAYRIKYSELRAETLADAALPQNNESLYYTNYGVGLMYYNDQWYFGVSVPKLTNRDNEELEDEFRELATQDQRSFYITTGGILKLTDKIKLLPGIIVENGSERLDVSLNFNMVYFDRLWTGFIYSSDGLFEANIKVQAASRLRLGFGQTFEMNELNRYHNGGFMVRAEYQFRDKNQKPSILF